MKVLAFQQVDVFTAVPFKGNPVAVVLEGDALSGEQMQSIAAWTNLSETMFVCTPTDQRADYRLRIFAPRRDWRSRAIRQSGRPTPCCAAVSSRARLAGWCRSAAKVLSTSRSTASGYSSRFRSLSFVNRPSRISLRSRIACASPGPTFSAQRSSMSDPCGSPFNS